MKNIEKKLNDILLKSTDFNSFKTNLEEYGFTYTLCFDECSTIIVKYGDISLLKMNIDDLNKYIFYRNS